MMMMMRGVGLLSGCDFDDESESSSPSSFFVEHSSVSLSLFSGSTHHRSVSSRGIDDDDDDMK